jgi:hypothetical protein
MDEGASGLGAVLADMGANLVTVLLILLAIAMSMQGAGLHSAVQTYSVQLVPTLSGRAQSDLLYQRLNPPEDTLLVEVTRQGVVWIDAGRARPVAEWPATLPRRAVVYVLSPARYGPLRDGQVPLPPDRAEMTVPEALQRPDGGGFSVAFLSIRIGTDPASIRPELKRLLQQGGQGREAVGAAMADAEAGGFVELTGWLSAMLKLVGNLTLLSMTLLVLRWLWRRTRPAL